MEPKTYPLTVDLSDYTLDIEQLDNLTSEYLGKILDANDDPIIEIEFDDANNLKAFEKSLRLTYGKSK